MGVNRESHSGNNWVRGILSKLPADRFLWYALILVPLLALLMMACGGGDGGGGAGT